MPPSPRFPFFSPLLALVLLWTAAAPLHAGPPYITDDPEPEEYHHWEINLATQDSRTSRGWSGNALHADIAYGVLPELELNLLAPFSYDSPRHEPGHLGYGDTQLGFKYRLFKENGPLPQASIAPFVSLPTGDHQFGLGNGKAQLFLPLWLEKSIGPWTSYGGAGWWFNPGGENNRDYWYMGWVVQRKITDSFTLGTEIFHKTADTRDGSSETGLNLGATLDLSDHYHLLFSAGHSVQGPAEFLGYFAFQISLGPEAGKSPSLK